MSTGTWMEAWTIPGTTLGSPPIKKIAFIPATSYSWSDPVSEVGRGSMSVPAAYERLAEILDPTTNVYSMIRVKRPNGVLGGALVSSWLARRFEDRDSDKEYDVANIGGESLMGLLQVGILPYDFPDVDAKGRSVDPNWQWGGEDEAIGFENRTGDLENWGAELGSTQHWYESTASELVNAPTSFKAIEGAGADTGSWYFEFTGPNNCWVGRRFTTLHASRYNVAVRVKAASGVNYRIRSGPAGAVFTGTLLSDFVAYEDGVGNGAWQTVNLEYDAYHVQGDVDIPPFTPGEAWVEVVNIDGAVATIQIDEAPVGAGAYTGFGISGNGIGVDDWRFTGDSLLIATQTQEHSGSWSMGWDPRGKTVEEECWAYRVFDVIPHVTYTMELWVFHQEAGSREFRVVLTGPGTTVADAFGDSGLITVAPSTWTRIIATGKTPMSRIEARLFYWETSEPATELFVDDDLFYQGQGPMSWTDIVDQLLDDLSLNHVGIGFERLAFVKHDSYTSTLDSDGVTLTPATVTYRAEVGKNIIEVLEDGRDNWGFEFDLIDLETPVGSTYVELKIWNAGGMGTDYSLGAPPPSTPAIVTGTNVQPTEVVKSMPVNDLTFQGDDGLIVRETDDALIDAAGALGTYDNNPEVLTIAAAQAAATQSLGQASQMFGIKTLLVESDIHTTPYYHFLKGDKLRITLPPAHPSAFRRAMSITGSVNEEDQAQFEVDWDKRVFASNPMRALARAVDLLWKKFDGREQKQLPIPVMAAKQTLSFGGGAPSIVVAASDASSFSRGRADFTCNGTNDDDVIQQAADLLTGIGGRLLLTEGTFNCAETLSTPTEVSIVGMGWGATRLVFTAVTVEGEAIDLGVRSNLYDLKVDISGSPGGFVRAIDMGIESRISGVWVESSVGVGIADGSGGENWIIGCHIDGTMTTGIEIVSGGTMFISDTFIESALLGVTATGGGECTITGCHFFCDDDAIKQTGNMDLRVSSSFLRGFDIAGVEIDLSSGLVTLNGCRIIGVGGSSAGVIVSGNTGAVGVHDCYIAGGAAAVILDEVDNVQLIGNEMASATICVSGLTDGTFIRIADNNMDGGGIELDNFDLIEITGNTIVSSATAIRLDYASGVTDARYVISDNLISNTTAGGIQVVSTGTLTEVVIANNVLVDCAGAGILLDQVNDATVSGNRFHNTTGASNILLDTCLRCIVTDNELYEAERHGIQLTASSLCLIANNLIIDAGVGTDNTYDAIILDGNSDRNFIQGNKIEPPSAGNQTRYGINISASTCNDNIYVGNWAGPSANFGTGPYNDAGTGTINTWPGAAAPQGDNFVL